VGDFTALQLAGDIEQVQDKIEAILAPTFEAHGLGLISVSVEDVVPPASFLASVEAEEVAARNADEAQNRVREAEAKADQLRASAQGEADAINIRALAEEQRMLRLGMTPSEYIWFTRDNLVLPQVMTGTGTDFILPLPDAPAPQTTDEATAVPPAPEGE
jgi:regulator of protease activity HflC (stomatin/prohibitin superfamily)